MTTLPDAGGSSMRHRTTTPSLRTRACVLPPTSIDLLSVLLHEQGHLLGLEGVEGSGDATNIMNGVFVEGERRLPEAGQADGAVAGSLEGLHYALTNGTWLGITGNWSAPATWVGGVEADGTDFTANFTGVDINGARTITLDTARTIGNITFTDATTSSHDLTISGANTLTLDRTTGTPTIDVTQSGRTLTISSVIAGNDGLTKTGLRG